MKLSINRNSWHFKVAHLGGLNAYDGKTDLCSYGRALLRAVFVTIAVSAVIAGAIAVMFAIPMAFFASWLINGVVVFLGPEPVSFALWFAVMVIAILTYYEDRDRPAIPGSNLLAAGYRSWKEKTCVLIEVQ